MKIARILYKLRTYLVKLIRSSKDRTPHYVALTMCVGVIAGIAPIIGQAYLCLLIWTVLRLFKIRFNLIASCALTFISNPFTTPFLFYLFYVTGQMFLGENMIPFTSFVNQLTAVFKEEYSFKMIKDTFSDLLHGLAKPIMLGYIPWGILGGMLGYYLGYQLAEKWRLRRQKRMLMKQNQNQ